mmetsp:Transcript_57025/g.152329  ORF Transcript_57025/g.152329 Transcript_57025/m.152329 type:complete len:681 (+) Transcript_57025:65-2107(+)
MSLWRLEKAFAELERKEELIREKYSERLPAGKRRHVPAGQRDRSLFLAVREVFHDQFIAKLGDRKTPPFPRHLMVAKEPERRTAMGRHGSAPTLRRSMSAVATADSGLSSGVWKVKVPGPNSRPSSATVPRPLTAAIAARPASAHVLRCRDSLVDPRADHPSFCEPAEEVVEDDGSDTESDWSAGNMPLTMHQRIRQTLADEAVTTKPGTLFATEVEGPPEAAPMQFTLPDMQWGGQSSDGDVDDAATPTMLRDDPSDRVSVNSDRFYMIQLRAVSSALLETTRFDVFFIDQQAGKSVQFQDCGVSESGNILFHEHGESLNLVTAFSGWVNQAAELYRRMIRVQVYGTKPRPTRVIDKVVMLGSTMTEPSMCSEIDGSFMSGLVVSSPAASDAPPDNLDVKLLVQSPSNPSVLSLGSNAAGPEDQGAPPDPRRGGQHPPTLAELLSTGPVPASRARPASAPTRRGVPSAGGRPGSAPTTRGAASALRGRVDQAPARSPKPRARPASAGAERVDTVIPRQARARPQSAAGALRQRPQSAGGRRGQPTDRGAPAGQHQEGLCIGSWDRRRPGATAMRRFQDRIPRRPSSAPMFRSSSTPEHWSSGRPAVSRPPSAPVAGGPVQGDAHAPGAPLCNRGPQLGECVVDFLVRARAYADIQGDNDVEEEVLEFPSVEEEEEEEEM